MRFLFAVIFCLQPVLFALAQEINGDSLQTSLHAPGDMIVEISPNIITNNIEGSRFAGGFNFEYFVSRRVNFNGYLFIGNGFGHLNLGLLTLPAFVLLGSKGPGTEIHSFQDFVLMVVLLVTVFENPSIHFPVSSGSDFSLNVSPLRIIWDKVKTDASKGTQAQMAFAAGIRYNKYFGRFVLSPYGEFCFGYSDFNPGINAGIHLGLYIPDKF
jgi:hypothetical protein